MQLTLRNIGGSIIELTVEINGSIITEDVCDANGQIEEDFINDLRDIANELEMHNKEIEENNSQPNK